MTCRLGFTARSCSEARFPIEAFVEFFFQEFDSRFNHIALNYLLFPDEVAGNIWESYPVPLYVAISVALGALLAFESTRVRPTAIDAAGSTMRRLLGAAAALGAAGLAISALGMLPAGGSGDRLVDEVAANGRVQLAAIFQVAAELYEGRRYRLDDGP